MATTTKSVVELDWDRIPDIGSGIRAILEAVRALKWRPDGTDRSGHWAPARWADEGVCGIASAYVGGWKVSIGPAFSVERDRLSCRRIERWEDWLVVVEPCPGDQAAHQQTAWAELPEGELGDEEWDAVEALDDEGLRDLPRVIEEVVRYLLDEGELSSAVDAAEEAVISDLRADLARWAERDARDVDLCRVAHAMASRD